MDTTKSAGARSVTDLTYLKTFYDSDEFIVETINVFLRQTSRFLMQMNKALKNSDWEMIKYSAHKVKPSFESMGMKTASELTGRIEAQAEQQSSIEEVKANQAELMKLYELGKEELLEKAADLLTK